MARWHFKELRLRDIAEGNDPSIFGSLTQEAVVILRGHAIEDHPNDLRILTEVLEAVEKCPDGIGGRACIDEQHRRDTHGLSDLSRRAMHTHIAIIQPHHPLEDDGISLLRVACIDSAHMLGAHHEKVKIDRGATAGELVELRVDVVGAALEALHGEATTLECTQ